MYEHTHTHICMCIYIKDKSLHNMLLCTAKKRPTSFDNSSRRLSIKQCAPCSTTISPRFKWTQISDVHCIRRRQALGRAATLLSVVWHEGHGGGGVDAETAQAKNS